MNIKNLSFVAVVATGLIANSAFVSAETTIPNNNSTNRWERLIQGLPTDPTKTPSSPDIIEHKPDLKGPDRRLHRKRIYFGTDKEGKPCYRSIYEHATYNPEFNDVKLVLFHKAAWYKLRFQDSFEEIGTYGDKEAKNQLQAAIFANGGVWCPELNTIIGGSREVGKTEGEQCICDRFAEFMQKPQQPSKFKK